MISTSMSRRAFLASASSIAAAGAARADDADVVIIGAGAAGIGAARELKRLGKSYVMVEARARAGGRMFTDTSLGQAFDAGAAYIHFAESNPWKDIASELAWSTEGRSRFRSGFGAYRDGALISELERGRRWAVMRKIDELYDEVEEADDVSLDEALSKQDQELRDLARGQAQLLAGEDPQWISTADWDRLAEGQNLQVSGGYGALAAKAAEPLDIRFSVRVTQIDWSGHGVVVTTDKGAIRAQKAILTVPVGVLKSGAIRFKPGLPRATAQALNGLRMGALTKVALQFDADRLGFDPHQFLLEIGDATRTMAFETWPFENNLVIASFGGEYARGLARQGEGAAIDHVLERFAKIAGNDTRKHFKAGRLAGWSEDPLSLGSYAVALPGRMRARDALAKPIAERLWIAGEATAGEFSMTAGGAYIAGREAARQVAAQTSTGSIR